MRRLSYYLDEDVIHGPIVAEELRGRGVDAITALEAGRAGQEIPDQEQLEYATRRGRVMVTQDVHFRPRLPHGGLIVMQRGRCLSATTSSTYRSLQSSSAQGIYQIKPITVTYSSDSGWWTGGRELVSKTYLYGKT